jgi:hypothetical protein
MAHVVSYYYGWPSAPPVDPMNFRANMACWMSAVRTIDTTVPWAELCPDLHVFFGNSDLCNKHYHPDSPGGRKYRDSA